MNKIYDENIFQELYDACDKKFLYGCGSYLFDGLTYKYCPDMYEKQVLLREKVKDCRNVLEIGTYMGHSLLIMLKSNPSVHITCIDIDDTYTRPCVEILNKHFNNRIMFIHGDSLDILPRLRYKYDLFHIDGHHENEHILKEFLYCIPLKRFNAPMKIIFDDQESMKPLQKYINDTFDVKKALKPMCKWNNIYYELNL
jgi:hypothetical protein